MIVCENAEERKEEKAMFGLVIGASEESIFGIHTARKLGMHVLAFDGDKEAAGLKEADEAYVVDIRKPEEIYAILEEKGVTKENAVVIPVPIGRYLISAGAVNDHFGLTGISEKSANLCTDKYAFHKVLFEEGLRNASCCLLPAGTTEIEAIDGKVVVKPRYGAGSRGVFQLSGRKEWDRWKSELPFEEDYVIETAIEGQEYGIDGMVSGGRFQLVLLRKKILTPPPVRQCVGYFSVPENSETDVFIHRVEEYVQKIVSKMGLENCILHGDLLLEETGNLFMIELSARPSGHRLHDKFTPLVTGVDMIDTYLRFATNGKYDCLEKKTEGMYLIHYFDMEECEITHLPSDKELEAYPLVDYSCSLSLGPVGKVTDGHSIMGRGYFILKGQKEEELLDYSRQILELFVSDRGERSNKNAR